MKDGKLTSIEAIERIRQIINWQMTYPRRKLAEIADVLGLVETENPSAPEIAISTSKEALVSDQDETWAKAWLNERGYSYDDSESLAELLAFIRKRGVEESRPEISTAPEQMLTLRARARKDGWNDGIEMAVRIVERHENSPHGMAHEIRSLKTGPKDVCICECAEGDGNPAPVFNARCPVHDSWPPNVEMTLPGPTVRMAVAFLLTRIGSWTHARWDQHLRNEVGDEAANEAIEWIEETFWRKNVEPVFVPYRPKPYRAWASHRYMTSNTCFGDFETKEEAEECNRLRLRDTADIDVWSHTWVEGPEMGYGRDPKR